MKTLEIDNNKIIIGENKYENDQIIKAAKDTHFWFHLDKLPSCHLILETPEINKSLILQCATLVKQHTKYKNIPKVTIIYTTIRNIKLTSEPGLVHAKKTKSIIV